MSVYVRLACDGCDQATKPIQVRQRFEALFSGRDHGFGIYKIDNIRTLAPDGWVAFDQVGTNATYCPACAEEIWHNDDALDGEEQ